MLEILELAAIVAIIPGGTLLAIGLHELKSRFVKKFLTKHPKL